MMMNAKASQRSTRTATIAIWGGSLLMIAVVAAIMLFQLSGHRYFIVQTPSMGRTAPVGTLVLDTPTAVAKLAVGDIISFHPPTSPKQVYTHRIVAIGADGGITTRGDINGVDDPWVVTQADLIGEVTTILPHVGWIIRAIPLLLVGSVFVWFATRLLRSPTRRAAFRISGLSFVVAATVAILHPFVKVILLTAVADHKGAHATIVSTGMLPVRVKAVDGSSVDLVSGEVGHITARAAAQANYQIGTTLNLPVWGWIIFFAVCSLPLLWTLVMGLPSHHEPQPARRRHRQLRSA
jgi:signal peptidase I